MPSFTGNTHASGGSVVYGGPAGPGSPIFWFVAGKMYLRFLVRRTPAAIIATGVANAVYYWAERNLPLYGSSENDEFAAGELRAVATVDMPEMWRRDP